MTNRIKPRGAAWSPVPACWLALLGLVRATGYAANMSLLSLSNLFISIAKEVQQRHLPEQAYKVLDQELRSHTLAEVKQAAEAVPVDQMITAAGPLSLGRLPLREWFIGRKEMLDDPNPQPPK